MLAPQNGEVATRRRHGVNTNIDKSINKRLKIDLWHPFKPPIFQTYPRKSILELQGRTLHALRRLVNEQNFHLFSNPRVPKASLPKQMIQSKQEIENPIYLLRFTTRRVKKK